MNTSANLRNSERPAKKQKFAHFMKNTVVCSFCREEVEELKLAIHVGQCLHEFYTENKIVDYCPGCIEHKHQIQQYIQTIEKIKIGKEIKVEENYENVFS